MRVSIRSLEKGILFEGEAISVNAKTVAGEITVLNNHMPLMGILTKGNLVVESAEEKKESFQVNSGFLEVGATNTVMALLD